MKIRAKQKINKRQLLIKEHKRFNNNKRKKVLDPVYSVKRNINNNNNNNRRKHLLRNRNLKNLLCLPKNNQKHKKEWMQEVIKLKKIK
jgi:hypothetical protein